MDFVLCFNLFTPIHLLLRNWFCYITQNESALNFKEELKGKFNVCKMLDLAEIFPKDKFIIIYFPIEYFLKKLNY